MILTVLISGKQGSGKTTLAKALARRVTSYEKPINFNYLKFADPLYAMQRVIQEVLASEFNTSIPVPDGPLLQVLGTEWGRKKDPNFWVKIMQNRLRMLGLQAENYGGQGIPTVYLIDDCRFPNELETFRPVKGIIGERLLSIRLEAPEHVRQVRAEKWRPATDHPSETALDGRGDWDKIIYTDTHDATAAELVTWKLVLDALYTP